MRIFKNIVYINLAILTTFSLPICLLYSYNKGLAEYDKLRTRQIHNELDKLDDKSRINFYTKAFSEWKISNRGEEQSICKVYDSMRR